MGGEWGDSPTPTVASFTVGGRQNCHIGAEPISSTSDVSFLFFRAHCICPANKLFDRLMREKFMSARISGSRYPRYNVAKEIAMGGTERQKKKVTRHSRVLTQHYVQLTWTLFCGRGGEGIISNPMLSLQIYFSTTVIISP
ncbi:hypothetical protein CEXT_339411 [Caerostris extrusa]|uniref:Uncharacterized protein n=1 Tax=Caerostris extrusa TaxID=172846 RepID=A0AAV4TLM2_CAEEX|nr:hypothetical protein CEXT_339411 [Caerostris extrusa]